MKCKILSIIITSLFFIITSCDSNHTELDNEERKMADSLYKVRAKENVSYLDSICDSVYNAEYPTMVDSIRILRMKEIDALISE
ncbi:MAG: hypothetical protein R2771_08280 [Saprospiraceae bacterium]